MSEHDAAPAGLTAGAALRQAREAAGLHVSTLAANLKVPVRKLEALEEDRYDLLPDAVFVRALASSVCRTLKIDPQPVLERLPQTPHPRLAQDRDGINAPFRPSGDAPRSGWLDQVSRPVALAVVALLLAAVVLIFLPARDDGPDQAANDPAMPPGTTTNVTAAPAEPRTDAASAPVAAAGVAPALPGASAPGAAAGIATAPASAPVVTAAAPVAPASAPQAAASAVAATPAASAPAVAASGALPADGIVVFRTTGGSSWVQVTDARGTSVLRRLMEPGETVGATGTLPLSVTVGNMGATEVQVRGQPFNMGSVSRDNVARFQVQ